MSDVQNDLEIDPVALEKAITALGVDFVCSPKFDDLMALLQLKPGQTLGVVYMTRMKMCHSPQ